MPSVMTARNLACDEFASGWIEDDSYTYIGHGSPPNTGLMYFPVHRQCTYFKTAGQYTFRFEALDATLNSGTQYFWNPVISAKFLPTSYGTVTATVASSEADDFSMAKQAVARGTQGDQMTCTHIAYEVDLRDLELRAARAEAHAAQLKAALREAQQVSQSMITQSERGER